MIPSFSNTLSLGTRFVLTTCVIQHLFSLTSLAQPISSPSGCLSEQQDQQDLSTGSRLSQAHQAAQKPRESYMTLHKLDLISNNVTCNDGSQAGYYMRLNSQSTSWVIYLQGGGFCESEESCMHRWRTNPHLMSSNFWLKTKKADGILSNNLKENPYLWHANHILVPYCSSDSWTGFSATVQQETDADSVGTSFNFMGSKIFEHVLESLYDDLPRETSLFQAKHILLAGDSAGGMGVLLNLDKANSIVQQRALSMNKAACLTNTNHKVTCRPKQAPIVRGLVDSGWFLDNEPFDGSQEDNLSGSSTIVSEDKYDGVLDCVSSRCAPSQSVKQAIRLWNGQVPTACANQFPSEPWRCYFGYRVYPTLQTPVFIVQWLYDEAQLLVDNIARPISIKQWNYVNKFANDVRASLDNVTALFAPSCFSHSFITRPAWNQITIDGMSVPQLLNSWYEYTSIHENLQQKSVMNNQLLSSNNIQTEGNLQHQQLSQNRSPSLTETTLAFSYNQESHPYLKQQRQPVQLNQMQSSQEQPRSVANKLQQSAPGSVSLNNRTRTRKRKRNNQQHRNKQLRQKSSPSYPSSTYLSSSQTQIVGRETSELISTINPLEDLLPLIDSSLSSQDILSQRISKHSNGVSINNGRPGRSAIVEDSSSVMTNNMQEDNLTPSHLVSPNTETRWGLQDPIHTQSSILEENWNLPSTKFNIPNQFRLMDSCRWPYCNRDCPNRESDSSLTTIQY